MLKWPQILELISCTETLVYLFFKAINIINLLWRVKYLIFPPEANQLLDFFQVEMSEKCVN